MKRLLRAAVRVYPRAWRDRYGDEFDALIDDLTPRWRHIVDVLVGALIMQVSRVALVPVALVVVGALAGVVVSLMLPPVYASSSVVLVQSPGAGDGGAPAARILSAIEAAVQETPLDKRAVYFTLREDVGPDVALVDVSASAGSALAARKSAEQAVGALITANFTAAQRDAGRGRVQFRVLTPPKLPTAERYMVRDGAIGGGAGLVASAFVVLLGRRRRPASA